jgi:hypothetical protein
MIERDQHGQMHEPGDREETSTSETSVTRPTRG